MTLDVLPGCRRLGHEDGQASAWRRLLRKGVRVAVLDEAPTPRWREVIVARSTKAAVVVPRTRVSGTERIPRESFRLAECKFVDGRRSHGDRPPAREAVVANRWRGGLLEGALVDALDERHVWCEARVVALSPLPGILEKATVHYRGWPAAMNAQISPTSYRLAEPYTKIPRWRATLDRGEAVQVGMVMSKRRQIIWRDGRIVSRVQGTARVTVRINDGGGEEHVLPTTDDMLAAAGTHVSRLLYIPQEVNSGRDAAPDDDDIEEQGGHVGPNRPPSAPRLRSGILAMEQNAVTKVGELQWRHRLLRVGELIEAQDVGGFTTLDDHWYEARVVHVDVRYGRVGVHYLGWPHCYDAWTDVLSDRLAPAGTHLGEWRRLRVGDPVQIGFASTPPSDRPAFWSDGAVMQVRSIGLGLPVQVLIHCDVDDTSHWRSVDDELLAPAGVPMVPTSHWRRRHYHVGARAT